MESAHLSVPASINQSMVSQNVIKQDQYACNISTTETTTLRCVQKPLVSVSVMVVVMSYGFTLTSTFFREYRKF